MEPSDWLPSAAAVVVGLTSAWFGSRTARYQARQAEKKERAQAFRDYERVIRDLSTDWDNNLMGYPGRHFDIDTSEIKKARDGFFPYLHEFENHECYYRLFSPYDDWETGMDPTMVTDFYTSIEKALRDHLRAYPNPLVESPYEKPSRKQS